MNKKLVRKSVIAAVVVAWLPVSAMADQQRESYGEQIGYKAMNGFANIATGWIELPKSIISVSNEHNVAFGASFGLLQGTMHTLSRTLTGVMDVATFMIPSKPAVQPEFVWQDFDVNSSYGDYFDIYE
ncbi:MAG: exosortase system-associated protein, TIGR04073 family [Methylococcales bacterium]